MAISDFDALRSAVSRHAALEGRNASVLPGVWFYRSNKTTKQSKTQALTASFAVVVQGEKRIRIGGRDLAYGPGNYLLLTGEAEYDAFVACATPDAPYLSFGLELPPDVVASTLLALADAELARRDAPAAEAFVAGLDDAIVGAALRMLRTLDDEAERRVLAPLAIREIVFHLLRSEHAAGLRHSLAEQPDRTRIARAMAFIRANHTRRISVADVARHVAMSPSHFAHCFRAVARVSPMRYVKHVRLHEARERMLRDGLRASEVASHVGYASPSHFARDFKTWFGVPPAEYAGRRKLGPADGSTIAGSSKTSVDPGMVDLADSP